MSANPTASADPTGEHARPQQSSPSWFSDGAAKVTTGVVVAVFLAAAAWAVNVDRSLTKMTLLLEQLTAQAPAVSSELRGVSSRVQSLESSGETTGKSIDKLEAQTKGLEERLRKLENGKAK